MDLNLFDVFYSFAIIILIDVQIAPSLTNRGLFKLALETFFMSLIVWDSFLAIWQMLQAHPVHFLFQARNQLLLQEALVPFRVNGILGP